MPSSPCLSRFEADPSQPRVWRPADIEFLRALDGASGVPQSAKRVAITLLRQQRRHAVVWIRVATLSAWLGLSPRTIRRALAWLEARGLLEREARHTVAGDRAANVYRIVPDAARLPDNRPIHRGPSLAAPHDRTRGRDVSTLEAPNPLPCKDSEVKSEQGIPKYTERSPRSEDLKPKIETNTTTGRPPANSAPGVVVFPLLDINRSSAGTDRPAANGFPPQNGAPEPGSGESQAPTSPALDAATVQARHGDLGWPRAFWQRLCRMGSPEQVDRVVGWLRSCPPSHPAHPRHPRAWVWCAVRDGWTEPPSWVRSGSRPKVRYVAVPDPCGDLTAATSHAVPTPPSLEPAAQEVPPWRARWEDPGPLGEAFRAAVLAEARRRLGPLAARLPLRGGLLASLCREIWDSFASPDPSAGTSGGSADNAAEANAERHPGTD
ncbi:MAG: hypothetical protein K6U87_10605 [Firmicutes bacterium]|nr:hypothetical protein [Bacillota bacterium]